MDASDADGIEINDCDFVGFLLASGRTAVNIRNITSGGILGCFDQIDAGGCYWGNAMGAHDLSDDVIFGVCGNFNDNAAGGHVTDGVDYTPFDPAANGL